MIKIEAINQELIRLHDVLNQTAQQDSNVIFARQRIHDLQEYLKTPATPLEIIGAELDRLHVIYKTTLEKPGSEVQWINEIRNDLLEIIQKLINLVSIPKKISLKPDDTLWVKIPDFELISDEGYNQFYDELKKKFPDNELLITSSDVELSIVEKGESDV